MKKIRLSSIIRLYIPLICMLALLLLIIREQYGPGFEARPAMLDYLEGARAERQAEAEDAELLVLYNGQMEAEANHFSELQSVLEMIDLPFRVADMTAEEPLRGLDDLKTVLLCSQSVAPLAEKLEELCGWIENGGHFAMLMTPAYDDGFILLNRKLGVIECMGGYETFSSIRFTTSLLPMYENGQIYDDPSMADAALCVRLADDCVVHMETGDARAYPLLWERPLGSGRVAVLNATLTGEKANRGLLMCALFALEDVVAYPIVNAGMVFVDDFPAPQPEGTDEKLLSDYGYSIQGFFRNHWWPDMKQLAWDYGVRYTGVLVETYNDVVEPPFEPDNDERALLRYYASELIHAGGEIGLHGYNHMPLCPAGFPYAGEDYKTWPSAQNMSLAIQELHRYGQRVLPEAQFLTYVPPSNYLSEIGQETLLKTLPQLRTISGLYLPETGVQALVQEFREEADGSVSVPRITSGFAMDEYQKLVCAQELLLHGVFSHFIHPDDVLDDERSGGMGWADMYAAMKETLAQINGRYPMLRHSTASEGAAAVQRYSRALVNREWEEGALLLHLDNLTDECWLAVYARNPDFTVEGGERYSVNDHLTWIRAGQEELRLVWEVSP